MTPARSRREFWAGVAVLILLLIAATNIINDRCSMAVAQLDEPTWEEQVDFEPGVGR